MGVMFAGIGAVFIGNMVLIVFLVLLDMRRVERAMTPTLEDIQNLSHGRAQHLKEQGGLAEINAGLNRAADYMRKKDNTRAEWLRGVSHDIRTPLSMVLGYASELENDRVLPRKARNDGMGIAPELLKVLNRGNDIASTQEVDERAEHGLGLKLVMQIVKAHRGTICFDDSVPHGLEVRISLPVLLNKDQSRNSHGYDTRNDGNQVLTGKLRRGDAADGGDGNHAPGNDGAAAYPDGRDLTQSGQNSGIEARGCGEGAGHGANQRKAGKAGAVQSGDDAHKDFDDHTENIVDRHMGGDKVADII